MRKPSYSSTCSGPEAAAIGARQDRAPAEAGIARIGVEKAALEACPGSPPQKATTARSALSSAIAILGAQLIEAEPLGEIGRLRRRAIEKIGGAVGVGRAHDDHVEQDLGLRREKRRIARLARREPLDVVGQETLQKAGRIRAAHANDAAILEISGFLAHRLPPVALARTDTVK